MVDKNEFVVFPENLSGLSDQDLQGLSDKARTEFEMITATDDVDDAGLERLEMLVAGIEGLAAELETRRTAATARKSRREQVMANLPPFLQKKMKKDEEEEDDTERMASKTETAEDETDDVEPVKAASAPRRASLQAAQARAPQVSAGDDGLAIVAAAPIAGMTIGTRFGSVDQLADAITSHAKGLVTSHGNPGFLTVASVEHKFDHVIHGDRTTHSEFDSMLHDLRSQDQVEAVVAGGGWCAPSEIRYDFFNIACQDGMVDLPTFGVQRGGIQFPVSPSLADVFTGTFTNATNPWLWTEADDILAATGSPTKPCVRVLCPDFDNERLECYGICLTAGNLTDSAYPEAVRNHLSLLMSAHYHAMNQRYIQRMVALSTAAIAFASGEGSVLSDVPDAVAIAAQDYRTRYGMCDDDVLEVILPRWVRDAMRSDHLRRGGFWTSPLSDADINSLFTTRRVRVQWVNDWQIRSANQFGQAAASALVAWPSTVDFLVYAAGTFIRGNGLTLDLGVVRDSVLNETNDHTASWTEECHLIARVGHESRRYSVPICVGGRTGAADLTDCHVTA